MTNKPSPPVDSNSSDKHQGMMGDGTEEQNLNQPGTTGARIKKDEVTRLSKRKRPQNLEAVPRSPAQEVISSVHTLKLTKVLGPNVWVIGTSAASRP